jgi:hypothetical protein
MTPISGDFPLPSEQQHDLNAALAAWMRRDRALLTEIQRLTEENLKLHEKLTQVLLESQRCHSTTDVDEAIRRAFGGLAKALRSAGFP